MMYVVIFAMLLLSVAIAGVTYYMHTRKIFREQKNFERGLKIVTLLIHLPPQSTDTDVGGRDERDVNDETISRAQILYGIISSTVQKGFKSKFYGQRHFSFEIVGANGFVKFYAAVPVPLLEVVQQAVTSAYPTARLEEAEDHNIFNPIGKVSGTMGGELVLKEDSAYPIATYQELKRDSIQSLLNAMSTLQKEDGAAVQILMRPADSSWRKNVLAKADKKRKGKDKKKGVTATAGSFIGQAIMAPIKPPEAKESGKGDDQKPLSGAEQAIVDAMEDKAKHPAFEVMIRVIASSNMSQRADSIVRSLVASFALYDSPGKNGFKFVHVKDIESFITAYIMRFFPPENKSTVLNSVELSTLFHFPGQSSIPTTQLERQHSKQVDGPRNIPEKGLMLGYNVFRGTKKKINLADNDRRRHLYAVGQTGTGKSTFLENLAFQDMLNGNGFAFIDPHGDTAEKLLSLVPKERTEDVYYFCPADMEYPMGLNMFEFESDEQKDFLIQESLNMLYKLYDPNKQGIIGPRFERIFTNCALMLMADPNGGTFVDIPKLLIDADFMKSKLKHVKDQNVLDFWTKEWPNSQRSNEAGEVTSWVVSKFGAFLSNEMMRNIIGQTKSSFKLREIMDNKKILIVNLSKGRTGELNSKLLGMIFVMKFQAAAMSRASMPERERVDFCLYVDEFQNYSTDSFSSILSEARKYGLNLIVANQFTTQLTEEIRDAIFGNVGSIVSFRVGTADAEFLARQFAPVFDTDDLQRIPNYNAAVRMLIGGVPTLPFSMAGLPYLESPNAELAGALKQLSAAKYGKPKSVVEKEIFTRLKTELKPTPPAQTPYQAGMNTPSAPKPGPSTGSSFLDDWLTKKQTNSFKAPASPFKDSTPPAQTQYQAAMNTSAQQPSMSNMTNSGSTAAAQATFSPPTQQSMMPPAPINMPSSVPQTSPTYNEPLLSDVQPYTTPNPQPSVSMQEPLRPALALTQPSMQDVIPQDSGHPKKSLATHGDIPTAQGHDETIHLRP